MIRSREYMDTSLLYGIKIFKDSNAYKCINIVAYELLSGAGVIELQNNRTEKVNINLFQTCMRVAPTFFLMNF